MKRILFPTDFSPNSDMALEYAARLCELHKCELIILHACHLKPNASQMSGEDPFEENILTVANVDLLEYCKSRSAIINDIKITQIVEFGLAADVIVDVAVDVKVDMIIMGTKGLSGLDGYVFGSNTLSVINKASCPVLAIPESSRLKNFKKIVFATDYRENDIGSIKFLSTFAESFKAEITILHVADLVVPDNYENALFELYKNDVKKNIDYKMISFKVLKGINHSKALNEYIIENSIDLIAVATRKKNLLTRIFDPSFTKRMLYHTHIPLLAIRPPKNEFENE